MGYRRGEIVLAPYPFPDLSTSKTKPGVVINSPRYQRERGSLLIAALTSNVAAATGRFDYVLMDWGAAGLKLPTAFKPVPATLDPRVVVHSIG